MPDPVSSLSLDAWGDIAQFVIGIAGVLALLGAAAQLRSSRANARRARVYEYSDRFNQPEMIRLTARYTDYWEKHSYEDFRHLDRPIRAQWLVLPNFIEEVAALYNRNLLDRDVAAEVLGMYVEDLWASSLPLVTGQRTQRNNPWI